MRQIEYIELIFINYKQNPSSLSLNLEELKQIQFLIKSKLLYETASESKLYC
jgi:hypothetical protein